MTAIRSLNADSHTITLGAPAGSGNHTLGSDRCDIGKHPDLFALQCSGSHWHVLGEAMQDRTQFS